MDCRIAYTTVALATAALIGTGTADPSHAQQQVLSASRSGPLASPDGRLLIGRGQDYVPSSIPPHILADRLRTSMKERRDFAWSVVEQMLKSIRIKLLDGMTEIDVPLWHTWYEGSGNPEVARLLGLYFQKLKPVLAANPSADVGPVIAATMREFSQKDFSTALTDANLSKPLLQNAETRGTGDLVGTGTTMFSPSFVEHVMKEARGISECKNNVANADREPPSASEFSWCIKEFPRSAVMVKTSWVPLAGGVPKHDTSATAMAALMQEGTWPGDRHPTKRPTIARPDRSQIYSVISEQEGEWGLAGIHFVTKDVREWVWVSLWWDSNAADDFGADRPAGVNGVWKNYKMCIASAFDEGDAMPWAYYGDPQKSLRSSIEAVYQALRAQLNGAQPALGQSNSPQPLPGALGPWPAPHNVVTTWCSNPNVETQAGNGRTNCIGCHQIVFTLNERRNNVPAKFSHALIGDYPQFGRSKDRKNFTGEFSWAYEFELRPGIDNAMQAAQFSWPPR
jgi:hypothetical protein